MGEDGDVGGCGVGGADQKMPGRGVSRGLGRGRGRRRCEECWRGERECGKGVVDRDEDGGDGVRVEGFERSCQVAGRDRWDCVVGVSDWYLW